MKITDKIISIPPYISTSWDKVASLYVKDNELVITLKDNTPITIPDLPSEVIEEIFSAHAAFLEQQLIKRPKEPLQEITQHLPNLADSPLALPFRLFFSTLESLNQAMHHNPNNSDLPPFPPDIVNKIETLARAIPSSELEHLPNPETGCNCLYCQMMRILKKGGSPSEETVLHEPSEEEVSDEELHFEQWDIRSLGEKLYLVTNKLDPNESYRVFLGDPIGCTCGKPNCEHIIAVLRH